MPNPIILAIFILIIKLKVNFNILKSKVTGDDKPNS